MTAGKAQSRLPAEGELQRLLGVEECVRYYPPNLESVLDAEAMLRNGPSFAADREIDLFLDVPYCNTICGFCPFNVYPYSAAEIDPYLEAVEREIHIVKSFHDFSHVRVRTVWVGGGTPAMLEDAALDGLMRLLRENFDLSAVREFTVEVKPTREPLSDRKLEILQINGVDRVSMGVQSANETFLRVLGRGHTAEAASRIIRQLKDAGFLLNIDMMYRLPGQAHDQIRADVDGVSALGVDHMSWFPYVPHAGTPLADRISRGRVASPAGRAEYFRMYHTLVEQTAAAGYRQYTPYYFTLGGPCEYHVDRWSLPQLETLGIGAGAFSFFNGSIYANEHNPALYRRAVEAGRPPIALARTLNRQEAITRLAVLGIKFFAIDKATFHTHSGVRLDEFYEQELILLEQSGLVELRDDSVVCTTLGQAFNNDIATILGTDTARRTKHPQAIDLMRVVR